MYERDRREFLQAGAAMFAGSLALPAAVTAREGAYADAVLVASEPPLPEPGAFTIAVLPDTQFYSEKYPETFLAQTRWIAEQAKARRIAAVLQLGDVTNRNTTQEWERAQQAIDVLRGVVPCFLAAGNHDYGARGGFENRTSGFSRYFSVEKLRSEPTFGGVYDREPDRSENAFHLFSAGDREFLVLSLEMAPRADVLRWANEIAEKHSQREAVLITHCYMYHDNTRYDWEKYGKSQTATPRAYKAVGSDGAGGSDGEQIWQGLVQRHGNFVLTLNGHVLGDGLANIVTPDTHGREVPQVLVNFQMKPNGGDGWLRLLECRSDRSVQTYDYSPLLKQSNRSEQNQFALKLPPVKTA
jgi:hypothetical protein